MVRKSMLWCFGWVLLQSAAWGQTPAGQDAADANRTGQTEQQFRMEMRDAIEAINRRLDSMAAGDLSQQPADLAQRVQALETQVDELRNVQSDQGIALGQIAQRGEGGSYHWRFNTNSQEARREFHEAMRSTVPEAAQFTVRNRTGRDECILINGERYTVPASQSRRIEVRPGTVTAGLPGQTLFTFHVGFPDYAHTVHIRERPAAQVVVARPVYAETPSWAFAY